MASPNRSIVHSEHTLSTFQSTNWLTWAKVGDVLSASRQAAFRRFGRPLNPAYWVADDPDAAAGRAERAMGAVHRSSRGPLRSGPPRLRRPHKQPPATTDQHPMINQSGRSVHQNLHQLWRTELATIPLTGPGTAAQPGNAATRRWSRSEPTCRDS